MKNKTELFLIKKSELLKRIGNISQLASVKKYRFDDGPASGMRAIEVNFNNPMNFLKSMP